MSNIRESLYKCLENSASITRTNNAFLLYSIDTTKNTPCGTTLYMTLTKNGANGSPEYADFICVTLTYDGVGLDLTDDDEGSENSKQKSVIYKINFANISSISECTYSFTYHKSSSGILTYYLSTDGGILQNINIKKDILFGDCFTELLTKSGSLPVDATNPLKKLVDISYDNYINGVSNGRYVEADDNTFINTLQPKSSTAPSSISGYTTISGGSGAFNSIEPVTTSGSSISKYETISGTTGNFTNITFNGTNLKKNNFINEIVTDSSPLSWGGTSDLMAITTLDGTTKKVSATMPPMPIQIKDENHNVNVFTNIANLQLYFDSKGNLYIDYTLSNSTSGGE